MKYRNTLSFLLACFFLFSADAYGQCAGFIQKTSCFPWQSGDGPTITYWRPNGTSVQKQNDKARLQRAINFTSGKLLFDEPEYFINDALTVFSYRIIEGTGKSVGVDNNGTGVHFSSKIVQVADKPIFFIGENIYDVSIRDIALIGNRQTTANQPIPPPLANQIGILMQGGANGIENKSSISFQLSGLKFNNLNKGIYVNALDAIKSWQCDNITLSHSFFEGTPVGVHINSHNAGLHASSIETNLSAGAIGFLMERSTYTTLDLIIGNGPLTAPFAEALVKIKEHSNISLRNSVSEGFVKDVVVEGNTLFFPIYLMNNHFMNGIDITNATILSQGNQFGFQTVVEAAARGYSEIYSYGDKFCRDDLDCSNGGYKLYDSARVVNGSNRFRNTTSAPSFMTASVDVKRDSYSYSDLPLLSAIAPNYTFAPLFRLGTRSFNYDFIRSETDGNLEVRGNQSGYSGYRFMMLKPGVAPAAPQSAPNPNSDFNSVTINNNGSLTLSAVSFAGLGAQLDGTIAYCADCQQTANCNPGGNGALAKRIAGTWKCN